MKRGMTLNGQEKKRVFLELGEPCYHRAEMANRIKSPGVMIQARSRERNECCDLCFLLPSEDLLISPPG